MDSSAFLLSDTPRSPREEKKECLSQRALRVAEGGFFKHFVLL
jgi:hypothetical protein